MSSLASPSLTSLALLSPAFLPLSLLSKVGARLVKLPLLDLDTPLPLSPSFFLTSPRSLSVLELLWLSNFLPKSLCALLKSDWRSVPPWPPPWLSLPERLPLESRSSR